MNPYSRRGFLLSAAVGVLSTAASFYVPGMPWCTEILDADCRDRACIKIVKALGSLGDSLAAVVESTSSAGVKLRALNRAVGEIEPAFKVAEGAAPELRGKIDTANIGAVEMMRCSINLAVF